MSNRIVERKMFIEAKPGTVFSYFTEAGKLCQWLGKQATVEPEERGEIRIDMNGRDKIVGTFKAIEPFERIVFTWGWVDSAIHPPGSSWVEITLTPHGDGTWLCLNHTSVPESERECHQDNWIRNLLRLQEILSDRASIERGA
ncbi:SRPBCC family protein [Cohnella hongkongensis]|uniref:SRPBCC domain-containing protein n=1 Tax=Cohnella hongkongensis TaxID=178337 RepID=A0ABV9F851_9BACL